MRTKSQYGKCPHMPNWVGFGVTKPSHIASCVELLRALSSVSKGQGCPDAALSRRSAPPLLTHILGGPVSALHSFSTTSLFQFHSLARALFAHSRCYHLGSLSQSVRNRRHDDAPSQDHSRIRAAIALSREPHSAPRSEHVAVAHLIRRVELVRAFLHLEVVGARLDKHRRVGRCHVIMAVT